MPLPNTAALLPLAESIADGTPVDWDAAEATATEEERAIIQQLRVLSNLATLHRSLPADPGELPSAVSTRHAAVSPAIGTWAHLNLIERLGGGAFAEVYCAWDRHLEREVALKLLRATESVDDPQSSRIATEGRLLARIRHPNVITVHGVAVHDGKVGLWMELVRGATLEQLLQKQGPFSAREASLVGIDLCRALAAIHAAGLIHRDVKAQNVMREDGGRIVLMDLGTGREIYSPGRLVLPDLAGTPLYLAPEIFDGAPASERTDLYSLGVLLYHLVTRSFPMRATAIDELKSGHHNRAAVRLRDARADLPTAFVRIVDRATANDPASRYKSAGELEADLVKALDAVAALPAPSPTTDADAPHRPVRSRAGWSAAAVGVLALVALTVAVLAVYRARSTSRPSVPTAARTVRLAVLPLQNLTGQQRVSEWPELIQALFVSEIAGVHNVAILDPLSLNALVARKLGNAAGVRNPQLLALMRGENVSLVVDGSIVTAGGGGFDIQVNLVDPVSGETRFPARTAAKTEEELTGAIRSLADGVLAYVQLQVLQLAHDTDLRPWISQRHQNIEAVNAFLQASQHIFRFERAAAERDLERAIELDPTFPEPRAWIIPGLITQGRIAEAQRYYDELLKLEPTASPAQQAMIGYVGARLKGDVAAQARELEKAEEYVPGNNIVLVNLAGARERLGDCAGALAALRPAIEMRWQYPAMYELWGSCSIRAGRLNDARQVLLDSLTLPPVHPHVYALLEAIAIADGDRSTAEKYQTLYLARKREIDRAVSTEYLVPAYARLASECAARGQNDCAAALRERLRDLEQQRR